MALLTKGRKKAEDKTDLGEKIRNSAAVMLRYMQMEMLSRRLLTVLEVRRQVKARKIGTHQRPNSII